MEWISVKDKKPIKRHDVLFTNAKDKWVSMGFLSGDNRWYNVRDEDCECEPTHWMPLPEPPKQK